MTEERGTPDGKSVLKAKTQKGWKRNAEEDSIISEIVHEPLVMPETWAAVQKAVAKR